MKRIIRASVPASIACVIGGFAAIAGQGFPLGVLFMGIILSYLVYAHWEDAQNGYAKVHQVIQDLRLGVRITEEKQPSTPPRPVSKDPLGTKTEPIGHNDPTVALDPDAALDADIEVLDAPEPDFIIGTTEDGRTITLDKITSMGVGGVPGSGKTVAVVGLATQAIVKYRGDLRIVVVDPHMLTGSEDALSARMAPLAPFYLNVDSLPNPVCGSSDLLKWIKWLTQEAKDRKGGKSQKPKILIVVDEFTDLMDNEAISEPLTKLLVFINEQARKVGMFALVASPAWKSSRVQGTDIRNTIASFLVHNMPPNIARQLVPHTLAETSNMLRVGQAIFSSFGVIETVKVPMMEPRNIQDCIRPYLPSVMEPPNLVTGLVAVPDEPGIAVVRAIWETYMILNTDLSYEEANVIHALAIDFYPGDPSGQEKVRKALKLGEEHL